MKHTYIHAYIHGYPTPLTAHSLAEVVLPIEVDGEPMWFAKEPVGLLGLSGLWNFSTTGASEINRHDESSTPKLKAPLSRKEGKMPPQTMNQTPPEPEAPKPEASPEAPRPEAHCVEDGVIEITHQSQATELGPKGLSKEASRVWRLACRRLEGLACRLG